jgi:hypothetical protein
MKKSDPFGKYRGFYGEELKNLWQDPSSIFENPAYTAALDFGMGATKRAMAASGFLDSGNIGTGLLDYSMRFGLDWLSDQEKFLAMLAGAQITPNYAPGLAAYAGGMGDIGGGVGAILSGLGGFSGIGGSSGTFGGGATLGGSGSVGTGWGAVPFGRGSWDVINAGTPVGW